MKTNANKSAAGAAFPSTRLSAPARSLATSRARLSGSADARAASEKRLKAVAPAPARTSTSATAKRAKPVQKKRASPPVARGKTKSKATVAVVVAPEIRESQAPAPKPNTARMVKASKAASAHSTASERKGTAAAPATAPTETKAQEVRTPPAVVPSVAPTHNGRGDATLARYMSELAGYELLGRDDEIRLAQEVERLEIAYWRSLLGNARAFEALEPAIAGKLEEPATELVAVAKTARSARAPHAAKTARSRYLKAVEKAAAQLRALDIHREAAKAAHEAAQEFADSPQAGKAGAASTTGHTKAVDAYLHEIDGSRKAQQMAKDRFVAANLRLVVSMARRYAREGRMPLADLIQEGNLGLMKAVERFDHRRGFRFSTYASWWIRHALTRGLADKGRLVRLPVHALETRTRLARATRKLTCRTGVAPTLAELAAETGLAPEKLTAVEELSTEAPFSLDAPVGGDNDRTFLDMLRYEDQTSAEESVVSESHKESLASLMGELSPFEAQILRYRYGFDGGEERTLKEIGQMYNLSRERIRQIQACALAKMRARVEDADQERAAL
jgi:RNA polymerase primary sigma factor